jgi:hypothetical protein
MMNVSQNIKLHFETFLFQETSEMNVPKLISVVPVAYFDEHKSLYIC